MSTSSENGNTGGTKFSYKCKQGYINGVKGTRGWFIQSIVPTCSIGSPTLLINDVEQAPNVTMLGLEDTTAGKPFNISCPTGDLALTVQSGSWIDGLHVKCGSTLLSVDPNHTYDSNGGSAGREIKCALPEYVREMSGYFEKDKLNRLQFTCSEVPPPPPVVTPAPIVPPASMIPPDSKAASMVVTPPASMVVTPPASMVVTPTPMVTPPAPASTPSKSGLSGGATAGIVIGSVIGFILIVLALVYAYRKYKATHP